MHHRFRSLKTLGVAMIVASAMASLIACTNTTVIVVTATPTPVTEAAATATSPATALPATEVPPTATALSAQPATPTKAAATNNTSGQGERVTFAAGESSTTRTGKLAKGDADTYLLNANAGQTMSVSLFPDGAGLNTFTIWSPSKQSWNANDVSYGGPVFACIITLPESGDYQVVVAPPAGETNPSTYQVTFMILNSSAQAPAAPPVRVKFAAGATEATVEGSMPMGGGSARYVLGASAGQRMTVRSSSAFVPVDFTVKAPSGTVWTSEPLATEGYLFSQSIVLPEAGDYVVTLNTPAGYDATLFTLNVSIENAQTSTVNPQTPNLAPIRIKFQPGATGATVKGAVGMNGHVKYVLGAGAGQVMNVKLNGPADSVAMGIYSSGRLLADAVTDWSGTLPATGDYEIDVYSTLGIADKEYTLDVSIVAPGGNRGSGGVPIRIKFQPGATSASVKGSVGMNGHVKYVLGAGAGQVMSVKLNGPADSVAMGIYSSGRLLADAVTDWSGTLPATGDYEIDVYSTLGIADKEYTLDVSIQ